MLILPSACYRSEPNPKPRHLTRRAVQTSSGYKFGTPYCVKRYTFILHIARNFWALSRLRSCFTDKAMAGELSGMVCKYLMSWNDDAV